MDGPFALLLKLRVKCIFTISNIAQYNTFKKHGGEGT